MDNSWWLIGGAVLLAFIAIKIAPAVIGASISVREAGRRYLSAEIKKYGIRECIPDACVFEVADHVTDFFSQYAQMKGQRGMWAKSEILEPLVALHVNLDKIVDLTKETSSAQAASVNRC